MYQNRDGFWGEGGGSDDGDVAPALDVESSEMGSGEASVAAVDDGVCEILESWFSSAMICSIDLTLSFELASMSGIAWCWI